MTEVENTTRDREQSRLGDESPLDRSSGNAALQMEARERLAALLAGTEQPPVTLGLKIHDATRIDEALTHEALARELEILTSRYRLREKDQLATDMADILEAAQDPEWRTKHIGPCRSFDPSRIRNTPVSGASAQSLPGSPSLSTSFSNSLTW